MFFTNYLRTSTKYIVITITVLLVAILYQKTSLKYENLFKGPVVKHKNVFTPEELSEYNGIARGELYLALMGNIFDVTIGSRHYGKDSPYHYFIGKDGTRNLVTGNFKDETDDKDHVMDLHCQDLLTILHWRQTFKQKYIYIGILAGRYYNADGEETQYMREVKQKIKQCKLERDDNRKWLEQYPPCNVVWTEDGGAKVWCTKSSGGIDRNWVGVPRQMITPNKPACVCVRDEDLQSPQLREYDDCPYTSTECLVPDVH